MGKSKLKIQGKSKGRGKKRKYEDSDGSDNCNVTPMKLKIRIGGNKFNKNKIQVDKVKEEDSDEIPYEGINYSIEEEIINEEVIVAQLEGEHFEPDAGYFEEVVDDDDDALNEEGKACEDDDNYDDDDDIGGKVQALTHNDLEDGYYNDNNDDDEDDDNDGDEDNEKGEMSDDEKKWLDALESGQLNENGEVKHLGRSNIALTARQRALLYGEKIEDLIELSSIQPAEMTEEQLLKRKKKALRRKQLEVEKTERDKKETLDRLLKKQDSRLKSCKNLPSRDNLNDMPHYRYTNNCKGVYISGSIEVPLEKQSYCEPKPQVMCGVDGCPNKKIYSCSRTLTPLCSLTCFKKNIALLDTRF